jgi:[acyl-carrier-protein] S-malonyltransferase
MQEAVPAGTGLMAAILGLPDAEVEAACREAAQGGVVEAVNYNSVGQVVIAGDIAAVQRAMEASKARGAKRALPLPVSVPSHSSLMKPAAERLGKRLESVQFCAPRIRYFSAVDGAVHADAAELRPLLVRQLASPVRWQHTVRALAATGIQQLIECGPGKVLTNLNKRVEGVNGVTFAALEDPPALDAALAATKGS